MPQTQEPSSSIEPTNALQALAINTIEGLWAASFDLLEAGLSGLMLPHLCGRGQSTVRLWLCQETDLTRNLLQRAQDSGRHSYVTSATILTAAEEQRLLEGWHRKRTNAQSIHDLSPRRKFFMVFSWSAGINRRVVVNVRVIR